MSEMSKTIYALPDSNHTGTYCDIDDGGRKYIRADALIEMLEGMKSVTGDEEWDVAYKAAIDEAIEKIKEM